MKYLKHFENNKNEYWLIDTKYLEIAVDKLKLSEEQKNYLLNNSYINGKEKTFNNTGREYYVNGIYLPIGDTMSWLPANDPDYDYKDYYKINGNKKYMGKLNITPDDILQYEMSKNTKKYNI